jgi:hypothetical protein
MVPAPPSFVWLSAILAGRHHLRLPEPICLGTASLPCTIRQTTAGEVLSLLYCPWSAKHLALDPFPEILDDRLLGLLTLDRARFARRFAGLGSEPVAG